MHFGQATMRRYERQYGSEGLRLHLGCGTHIVSGWVNIDGSWNARLAQYPIVRRALGALRVVPAAQMAIHWQGDILFHNLAKPLPFRDGTAACIYSSHVLEHLYHEDAKRLVQECVRVLGRGGIFRLVVPDLHAFVMEYLETKAENGGETSSVISPADHLNERLQFRSASAPGGSILYRLYSAFTDFHSHKWMYDADSIKGLLLQAGLARVEERGVFDSRIEGIELIEQPRRIADKAGVCVEGVKES